MNKSDFVARLAATNGISQRQSKDMVDAVLDCLVEVLREGERVSLSGFGVFEIREHREKTGRNPSTGERILLPKRHVLAFTGSRTLKKSLGWPADD